jgi:enoyl-CoA hydratase/carnithine racemase
VPDDAGDKELVTYRREGKVAYLTLNRPEKLNAISDDLVRTFKDCLDIYDADDDAWVAILSGNGRAFSAGADVRQRQLRPRDELVKFGGPQAKRQNSAHVFYDQVNWKPIVAACHGYALGAGLGWCLGADLVVAAEGTKFQITEVSRGLSGARIWRLLAERTGFGFADQVALTGRVFTAEEGAAAGFVNELAPVGKHMEVAEALADQILGNPPLAVRLMVRARRMHLEELDRRWTSFAQPYKLHLTEDFRSSAQGFVDKVNPTFEGR